MLVELAPHIPNLRAGTNCIAGNPQPPIIIPPQYRSVGQVSTGRYFLNGPCGVIQSVGQVKIQTYPCLSVFRELVNAALGSHKTRVASLLFLILS